MLVAVLLWQEPDLARRIGADLLAQATAILWDRIGPGTSQRPLPAPSPGQTGLTGTARVIDGDTLDVNGTRLRLYGIDAPESRQTCARARERSWRCGAAATAALGQRIGGRPIACEKRDVDRYGRVVAVCRQGGEDLNGWMVRHGWAVAYRAYSRDYVDPEAIAKAARRGIWASRFQMPWEWRKTRKGGAR